MSTIRTLIIISLLCLPGCAALTDRPKPVCVATGLAAGLAAAMGVVIGALAEDCGPHCEYDKVAGGERLLDATTHHIEQRNAIIELGAPMAFVGFGLGGYAACMEVLS